MPLRRFLEGLLTAVIVAAVLVLVAWFTLPRLFGYEPQVVLSGSMEPNLKRGGIVLVKHRPASEVQLGDRLTYHHPERPRSDRVLVTHRVIEVIPGGTGPSFRTRGDANDGDDPWVVRPEDVLGTVEWHVPYLGYAAQSARSPLGLVLLVGIPGTFLAFGEVRTVVAELRARNKRNAAEGAAD